jgi:hypothetical protein
MILPKKNKGIISVCFNDGYALVEGRLRRSRAKPRKVDGWRLNYLGTALNMARGIKT